VRQGRRTASAKLPPPPRRVGGLILAGRLVGIVLSSCPPFSALTYGLRNSGNVFLPHASVWHSLRMCSASLMTRRSTQLRKAPSRSKPGGFRDAFDQQLCTADSAILESANISQAVYSSVLRHRENHSSNSSNWLREVCGFVSCDVKISVVVAVVIVSYLDEETRAGAAYSIFLPVEV
jgi:hypothetical protein